MKNKTFYILNYVRAGCYYLQLKYLFEVCFISGNIWFVIFSGGLMRKRTDVGTSVHKNKEEGTRYLIVCYLCTCVSSACALLRWLYLVAFISCTHTKNPRGNDNKRYLKQEQKHETSGRFGRFFTVNSSYTQLQTKIRNLCWHETNTHVHTVLNYQLCTGL